ncbi:MAG: head GIN domain-containing protein [Planctomycetota bacterium]
MEGTGNGLARLPGGTRAGLGLLLAGALALGSGACSMSPFSIRGSGVAASEERTVGGFQRLSIGGSARVHITVGPPVSLRIRTDDNLLPHVITEVEGDTLKVHMESGSYNFRLPLEVTLSVPDLHGFSVSGSARAQITGLHGGEFSVSTSGSSRVQADGTVDRLKVGISGSGSLDLHGVEAQQASVRVSGSGSVKLQVREELEARISGSGNLRYGGRPRVSAHISGSGSITPE